jgi:hypothetical protein
MCYLQKQAAINSGQFLPCNSLLSDGETSKLSAAWFSPCSIQSRKEEKHQANYTEESGIDQLRHLKR